MAWYNKYRPTKFEDVIGQDLVKNVLQNAIKHHKIKHAYLFNGPKGVGKTTLARIFANQINQISENPEAKIDIVEMDAASNTSIDDIRLLIESSKTPPLNAKYKIYIIDEVHMLSKPAMNALLKILEEPPVYLVFLLATTNPEKLIPTVLSRLTKLNLQAHSNQQITTKLSSIAQTEGLKITPQALEIVAKRAQGSQRDAINLLETIASYDLDKYDQNNTSQLLGLVPIEILDKLATCLTQNSLTKQDLDTIDQIGVDGETFLGQFLEFLLDESLNNPISRFTSLIIPTSEVLSLQLPITTTTGAVAILQAKLGNTIKPADKPEQSPSSPSSIQPIAPAQISTPQESLYQNYSQNQTVSEPTPVYNSPAPTQSEQIESDTSESSPAEDFTQEIEQTETSDSSTKVQINTGDPERVNALLQEFFKLSDLTITLKMLAADLKFEKFEQEKPYFSLSNGMFQAQLNLPDNRNKLINFFEKNGLNISDFQTFLRDRESIPNPYTPVQNTLKNEFSEKKEPAPSSQYFIDPTPAPQPNSSESNSKYFYSVYRELPPEIKDSKMPVWNKPLPEPTKSQEPSQEPTATQVNEPSDWDSHASTMFDFE